MAPFKTSLVMASLPCVHIHLLSSDWERHLWLSKYFKQVSVCVVCAFPLEISPIFGKSFPFLYFVLSVLRYFPFHVFHYVSFWKQLIWGSFFWLRNEVMEDLYYLRFRLDSIFLRPNCIQIVKYYLYRQCILKYISFGTYYNGIKINCLKNIWHSEMKIRISPTYKSKKASRKIVGRGKI